MAEHIFNQNLEFFYCGDDSFFRLFDELNARFSYQKVAIVGSNQNLEQSYNSFRSAQFFVQFDAKFEQIKEDTIALVCTDLKQLQKCQEYCMLTNKFLIVVAQSYVPLISFVRHKKIMSILGVVMDKRAVSQNFDTFKINFLLDSATLIFDYVEKSLCNLFFKNGQTADDIKFDFDNFVQKISTDYNTLMNEYSLLIEHFSAKKSNVLDYFLREKNMPKLCLKKPQHIYNIFTQNSQNMAKQNLENSYYKLIAIQSIISLYKLFIFRITPNLKRVMNTTNMEFTPTNLENFNNFSTTFNQEKFWFVRKNFSTQILKMLDDSLMKIEKLKRICMLININTMYVVMQKTDFSNIKQKFKHASLNFDSPSFLAIINFFGYLDF